MIYIFFSFFSFCECVWVWFFVWFRLYSFALTICPKVLSVGFLGFFFFFSIIFSAFYHWWICFLVWLLFFFFLFFNSFLLLLNFLYFYNYLFFILITLFHFVFFFLSFFFCPFSSEPWDWQGLGYPAGCQACASEVGELSSGYQSTRDLQAPRNIKQQKLSQSSPSQR